MVAFLFPSYFPGLPQKRQSCLNENLVSNKRRPLATQVPGLLLLYSFLSLFIKFGFVCCFLHSLWTKSLGKTSIYSLRFLTASFRLLHPFNRRADALVLSSITNSFVFNNNYTLIHIAFIQHLKEIRKRINWKIQAMKWGMYSLLIVTHKMKMSNSQKYSRRKNTFRIGKISVCVLKPVDFCLWLTSKISNILYSINHIYL